MMKKSILILLGSVLGSQVMGTQSQGTPGQRKERLNQQIKEQSDRREDRLNKAQKSSQKSRPSEEAGDNEPDEGTQGRGFGSNVKRLLDLKKKQADLAKLAKEKRLSKNGCPVLDLTTLPKAACATENKPYTYPGSPHMRYHNTTNKCPSGLGARKFFQKVLGNNKGYEPALTVTPEEGEIKCTYTLPTDPKDKLKKTPFFITAPITSMKQVSGLANACPELNETGIEELRGKDKKVHEDYEFIAPEANLLGAVNKVGNGVMRFLTSSQEKSENYEGTLEITVPFTHTCQYTYNVGSGKKGTELILKGESVFEGKSVVKARR
jgi:hypothetical protein